MLDLNDLRLFVHIVDHRGILKAGRALGLPKSTMSRRLAALEEHLKARLVIRSGEEFQLTAAGQQVYAAGRNVVDMARQAEEQLSSASATIGGPVTVSTSRLFTPCLSPYLREIRSRHPAVTLTLEITDRLPEHTGDGTDLHLCAHFGPLRDSTLIQRRICRNPTIMVAAPTIAAGVAPRPVALGETPLFVWGRDPEAILENFSDTEGASVRLSSVAAVATADTPTLVEAAVAGKGVAILPEYAARPYLASGVLVPVLENWRGPAVMVTLLSPPRRLMNPTLRLAADTLGGVVKSAVLGRGKGVPEVGWAVPFSHPPDFTELSSDVPSQVGRAAAIRRRMSARDAPKPVRDEMTMNTFQKALGIAAVSAVSLSMPAAAQDADGPLVLYTNDFEGVITNRFEADTGREIDVVQMSGGEILARIAAEASNPQWDVLVFNGSYSFHSLDLQGQLLQDVEPANIGNLNAIGRQYLPENRSWFPIGMAASCVMLYRTDLVDNPPASFDDLADPRFNGMFGMADPAVAAPAYPCVAEFFESRGMEEAEALFTSYFDNGMRVFRTNGPTGQALIAGDIALALITSQVAYSQIAAGDAPLEVVWPEDGAPGVVRGVGIQAQTGRPEAAKAFVEWLLEADTQSYLAASVPSDGMFEPTVEGAVRRADGPPEGMTYRVASDAFAVENEAQIKTWFADRALN
ncbi:extracellular solute-binding protein [Pelagibacterium montanilacus]|uniref:extracellular solute-binding protein n=1 Tax=Pelagibacterium montanilacus TaxID=2185280 RepID=UPI000F8EF26A|nr:extracellular solute-binding protein [Pelagibacterium montanilacus]